MEDDEPAKPAGASRQAAARREAALQRTAKWRDKSSVWPPPPARQEVPRQVEPPPGQVQPAPGLLQQVLVCVCQFIGGLLLSYAVVGASYILMSPFIPEHSSHHKPQVSEIPTELLEMAFISVIVVAVTAVFFRKSQVFAVSFATGGILYMVFSMAFLGM